MSDSPLRHCSDRELLALLLGDDVAPRLADRSLADLFGLSSYAPSVNEVSPDDASTARLAVAKELMCRALTEGLRQRDVLDSPDRIRELLRLRFAGLPHEVFVVLLLDAQNHLIDTFELFRGTLTQTSVYPREIVKLALSRNAAAVVFAHNHPLC